MTMTPAETDALVEKRARMLLADAFDAEKRYALATVIREGVNHEGTREALRAISTLSARVVELEGALRTMVYETMHLSPLEDDGSHWCRISAEALQASRSALKGEGG